LAALLHQFSDWYLSTLSHGGYWLIAGLMALESTLVPIPSEVIIPPAAYLAHTQGEFSFLGVVLAGTAGSWVGASAMYWAARLLGHPVIVRYGRYVGLRQAKIELAERWCAHYGPPGVFLSRLLPVIRHLIGIPT
jgi:membrane protein DedA with SNARE-associated domain